MYVKAGTKFGAQSWTVSGHRSCPIMASRAVDYVGMSDSLMNYAKKGSSHRKAEPDIWMRDKGDHYEYIVV